MTSRTLLSREQSLNGLFEGIRSTARVVGLTYGPRGRNVMVERDYGGRFSRDGVSISRVMEFEDPLCNLGAKLLKNVAVEMSDIAGDGTSLVVILSASMMEHGLRARATNLPVNEIRSGIDLSVKVVDQFLLQAAADATENTLLRVAETAAQGDLEIAALICQSLPSINADSYLSVELGDSTQTELVRTCGLKIDAGYISSKFASKNNQVERSLLDPLILVTDLVLDTLEPLIPLLDKVYEVGRELCIIGGDISGEVLSTLITNNNSNALKSVAIRAPGNGYRRTEKLMDIALMTGAKFISSEQFMRLEDVSLEDLGKALEISVGSDHTHIKGGEANSELVAERSKVLRARRDAEISEFEREEIVRRMAWLYGESISIKIGGLSEDEIKERRDRAVNCVQSVKASQSMGVLSGGGMSLLMAKQALTELEPVSAGQKAGIELVEKALELPAWLLAENQGFEGSYFVAKCEEKKIDYLNLLEGPIDPLATVRLALTMAASTAKAILSSEYVLLKS